MKYESFSTRFKLMAAAAAASSSSVVAITIGLTISSLTLYIELAQTRQQTVHSIYVITFIILHTAENSKQVIYFIM